MSYPLVCLGDIADFINGVAFKPEDWGYEGKPIIRIQNLNDPAKEYNYTQREVKDTNIARQGDLLVSWSASLGVYEWSGNEAYINQHIFKVIPNEKINKKYLKYALELSIVEMEKQVHGATMKHITRGKFLTNRIPLPPLTEQRRIAAILDKADELRQKRQQSIEKLDQLLQATFIDMFGDPVSNPKGWEIKKLVEMTTKIHSGNTPKGGAENYVDKGIVFLRSQNVWKNKVILDGVAYIDMDTHSKMSKSSVKHEDLLITKTGRINTENSSLGRAAMYLGEDDSANINGHVYLIRIKEEFNKYFIMRILTLPDYYEYIRSVCVGGIDKRQLNKEHIENFPIIQPPIELQNKFSKIVHHIEKQKTKLIEQLNAQENLFCALQNQAFNGTL